MNNASFPGRVSVCVCVGRSPQEDLSMPIVEEDIDGLSGLLFPFYDADTHMLYLAGKVSAYHSRKMRRCLTLFISTRVRATRRERNVTGRRFLFKFFHFEFYVAIL